MCLLAWCVYVCACVTCLVRRYVQCTKAQYPRLRLLCSVQNNSVSKLLSVYVISSHLPLQYQRIDLYVTPYRKFPCTLLHFTGSGHFNCSMRNKADKMVSAHYPLPNNLSLLLWENLGGVPWHVPSSRVFTMHRQFGHCTGILSTPPWYHGTERRETS